MNKITILDDGTTTVPSEVRMSICEIADLFGVYYQTAKTNIRAIQKSGIADGDYTAACTVEQMSVYPDYYGLEMITALAFRLNSPQAKAFRKWIVKKAVGNICPQAIMVKIDGKQIVN